MTNTSKTHRISEAINQTSVIKAALSGAGIGLVIILTFITGAETQSHWPSFWRIRPLIITPLAGAMGGSLAYISTKLLRRKKFNGILTLVVSLTGFVMTLWLGIVLGLEGTLWD